MNDETAPQPGTVSSARYRKAPLCIVGVGASAGGLESLERLFTHMPDNTGLCFVVIQHLSPKHKTLMDELLARRTALKVQMAEDRAELHPNTIYLLPPKKDMIVSAGQLLLSEQDEHVLNLPIDRFFSSLAQESGERAAAIVLSGTGSDGSRGIKDIKAADGLVLCESEATAKFSGMPKSAQATGCVDQILAPEEMSQPLIEYMQRHSRRVPAPQAEEPAEQGAAAIFKLLLSSYGIDFRQYKPSTAGRRIERRIEMARSQSLDDYIDIHRDSITFASRGIYAHDRLEGISEERLARHFERKPEGFRVAEHLRQMVVFAPHNVLKDAPFTNLNLITCRNMLIYFEPQAQRKVFTLFHFALKTNGILMLGPSESLGELGKEFATLDEHCKLYQKQRHTRLPVDLSLDLSNTLQVLKTRPAPAGPRQEGVDSGLLAAYDTLLNDYMPAAILINEQHELVDSFGGAAKFLHFKERRPSNDLLELLDSPVKASLSSGLRRAQSNTVMVSLRRVPLRTRDDNQSEFNVLIKPVVLQNHAVRYFLLTFEPVTTAVGTMAVTSSESVESALELHPAHPQTAQFEALEAELRYTKENLQATIEELESSNEELQATNEELVASNEELQSSNEELNSVNEELHTVNTEYQNKIAELRELNEDMNHLLASTDIGTIFLDRELNIRRFTPGIGRVFQLTPQDIGRPIEAFSHRLEFTSLFETLHKVLQEQQLFEQEVRDRDGHALLLRVLPYQLEDQIAGVVLTLTDIGLLDEARAQLAASEARARSQLAEIEAVYNTAPIGLCVLDRDLRWRRINERLAEINGIPVADHIGKSVRELLPDIADDAIPTLRRIIETGEPVLNIELSGETPAQPGVRRDWVEQWYPLKANDGKVLGINVVAEEITERKQAEQALRDSEQFAHRVLDSLVAFAGVCTPDGTLIQANRTALKAAGLRAGDVLGKPFEETYWWSYSEKIQQQLRQAIQRALEGEMSRYDVVIRVADDRFITIDFQLVPMHDDNGRITHLVPSAIDVSERKKVEQSLSEARQVAELANRAKSEFLANMSHEIRTPMTAILGYTELLAGHLATPEALASIDTIRRNGQHLLAIINDILDLSKIEAGQLELHYEPMSPQSLITDIQSMMALRAREKQLDFTVDFESLLPETIISDARRLKQILINLLGNAIKFTEQGKVQLKIRLLEDAGQLEFRIIDTGIGINPEQQKKLFQPFSQLETADTRLFEGSGLGLVISRRLIDMLGGELALESQRRKGSTFTLTLPTGPLNDVTRVEPQLRHSAASAAAAGAAAATASLNLHILVVDDKPDIRILITRFLEEAGASVVEAGDGQSALRAAAAAADDPAIDLIIMDMQMPGMDGYTTTRRLRQQGFSRPVIALTAGAMAGDREKCLAAGCDDYLSKPVDRVKLIELMTRYSAPDDTVDDDTVSRVLLVEDNEDARNATAQLLTLSGFDVRQAVDGMSALLQAQSAKFDAILLDIGLPDMSGFEVAARLKVLEGFGNTRLIALTGYGDDPAQFGKAGFDHYLIKPLDIGELVALLKTIAE